MTTEMDQRSVCNGVTFRSYRDSRFKTMRISVHFLLPLEKDRAAVNAILPFLLRRASRKYPDYTKLNEHLEQLYGASLDADVQKLGDVQLLSVTASGLADRYVLNGECVSAELSRLLCSVLFDPPLRDGLFPEDGFLQERRQLMETLDAEFNDKQVYAYRRCMEIMCAGEPYGLSRCGTKKDLEHLERCSLTKAWEYLIHSARTEIMVFGDCDPEPIYREFSAAFRSLGRGKTELCSTLPVAPREKTNDVTEKMDVAQSKLVLGFRTGCAEPEKEVSAYRLLSALYGGSPNSKLFLNVREKMSLCYYCGSGYNSLKGILAVQSGVEQKNMKKARGEIVRQLEEIQMGNFTEEELDTAKRSMCNGYRSISDSLEAVEGWYLTRIFSSDSARTPEQETRIIQAVTREEVTAAAQNIVLDTAYQLTGNEVDAE